MSLQVWLPLNGNLDNQGLSDVTVTNNGATIDNNGKIGKCYNFTSTSARLYANNVSLSNSEMTAACWAKFNDLGSSSNAYPYIISLGGDSTVTGAKQQLGISQWFNSTKAIHICANGSELDTGFTPTLNTWYHLCFTYKGSSSKLYVNGELYYTGTNANTPQSRSNLCIGARSNSASGAGVDYKYPFNGYLNDVRIYDHALSEKEVKELSKGLVAHYPLSDTGIENTTNLITSLTKGGRTTLSADGESVTTTGEAADTYFYINTSEALVTNTVYTLSFDVTELIGTYNWKLNNYDTFTIPVKNGHNIYTFTANSNLNGLVKILFDDGTRPTIVTPITFTHFQLEKKDHATVYAGLGGSRNETTVYDVSGYNYHGIINTAMTVDENTARYNYSLIFDGVSNAIQIPFNEMLGLTTASKCDYTISVFTYKTVIGTDNYQTILGGPSGFELEAKSGTATDPLYRIHNWGGGTTPYEFGKWTLFTFVHTTSDCKLYVNGELKITGSSQNVPIGNFFIGAWKTAVQQNFQGNMSDFRIYATALSAEDVAELYNTAASLANNGTLFAYEYVEV